MSRSRRILSTRELNRAIRARQELRIAAKSPSRKRNPDRDTYEVLESTRIGRPSWGASENVSPAPNHGDLVACQNRRRRAAGSWAAVIAAAARRRAGRSAAVIAGSCGGSCPSASGRETRETDEGRCDKTAGLAPSQHWRRAADRHFDGVVCPQWFLPSAAGRPRQWLLTPCPGRLRSALGLSPSLRRYRRRIGYIPGVSAASRTALLRRRRSPPAGDAGWACRSRRPAVGGRTELATRAGGAAVRSAFYSCEREAGPATRRRRQHGTCHSNRSPVQLPYNQRRRALARLSLSDRLRVSPGDVNGVRRNLCA